ncbi:APC family permease [Olsenella sp. YH-ols2217]|uniref:APC family permease n=1 Tax=Kribbibacterium absianum TaxID=3044210 RepID=A0ABT6ZHF0_9ACTN|nr:MULTISPECIES: APC family permease [unclassified Olsenella]MDJ1120985.1 APC family permease [Olsenella sp. YH-ols2216]MDJ1128476.1 APC family permease [Olsenella sp. YH-ols2217]
MSFHHHHDGSGGATAAARPAKAQKGGAQYISLMALVMMNVTIIGSVANDVQQAFYGLSSVTLFIIGALVFFLPTGLVAAELASGWGQRGGIFRWVGEALGPGFAFACLLILWFQTSINFGSGVASAATTIGFYTPDWDWAVQFMNHPKFQLLIMCAWLAYYWLLTWMSTKGVKVFAKLTKYGVIIGTFIPLAFIVIFTVVWLAQGNVSNVTPTPEAFNPLAGGFSLTTMSLAAGVFFSFAGIDMNAAHIKQLKNPQKEFPASIFIAMILTLIIFIAGTVCIAIVTPKQDMNLVYGLFQTYKILGATFSCPWIYVAFVWAGLATSMASLVTNMAGPSFMLGQAARSGFLPKALQSNNKHGMPSRLMYAQMGFMTAIGFLVFLIPNIEGFVILITQSITVLYMLYYVLMFVSFLKLRHDQPNRPRLFKVPGGNFGAWLVSILGLASCIFGITLAIIPPAQVKEEVGSPVTYVAVILALIIAVIAICFVMYRVSKKHPYKGATDTGWVDPTNQFAPFTWQIEGLEKPAKVLSNVPSEVMCAGQNPMGMPIKKLWNPDEQIPLPPEHTPGIHHPSSPAIEAGDDPAALNHPVKTNGVMNTAVAIPMSQPTVISKAAGMDTAATAGTRGGRPYVQTQPVAAAPNVPPAPAAEVAAEKIPSDPAADAKAVQAKLEAVQSAEARVAADEQALKVEEQAYKDQISADSQLADAERAAKTAEAAAAQATADAVKTAKPDTKGDASTE